MCNECQYLLLAFHILPGSGQRNELPINSGFSEETLNAASFNKMQNHSESLGKPVLE